MKQSLGLIRWFDNEKGFGNISSVDGKNFFIHIDQFSENSEKIKQCETFFFDIKSGKKGLQAQNVSIPSTYEHFKYIMSLREKDSTLLIETTTTRKNNWGTAYTKNVYRKVSIFDFALSRTIYNKDYNTVKDYFINFFDENSFNTISEIKKIFEVTRNALSKMTFKAVAVGEQSSKTRFIVAANIITDIFNYYILKIDKDILFELWKEKVHYPSYSAPDCAKEISLPEEIFLDNYHKFNAELIDMLLYVPNGEYLSYLVLLEKIKNYNEVSLPTYSEINTCIGKLKTSQYFTLLEDLLFNKNLELILENKDELQNIVYFKTVVSTLNLDRSGIKKSAAVIKINSYLTDEQIFKYWQDLRYFIPEIKLLNKFLQSFSNDDFKLSPSDLHTDFFMNQFYELHFDNSIESLYRVFYLSLEIPGFQIKHIEQHLLEKYKAAIWLYDCAFVSKEVHGVDTSRMIFKPDFTKDDFVCFIDKINDVAELTALIKGIFVIKKYVEASKKQYDGTLNFLENLNNNIVFITNPVNYNASKFKFEVIHMLSFIMKEKSVQENFVLFKKVIPKFLDLNIEENYKNILSFDKEFENCLDTKKEFYSYLYKEVLVSNQIKLVLDDIVNENDIIKLMQYLCISTNKDQFQLLQKIFSVLHADRRLVNSELYINFQRLADKPSLNLNVRLALHVVLLLKENSQFVAEKTIFGLVSESLNENIDNFIKISNLLENCSGRTWKSISYTEKKSFWSINIDGRFFNVENNFAIINGQRYELDKENSTVCINDRIYKFKWTKNDNIFHSENYGTPYGITFCDAVQSQYDDDLKSKFYWCSNNKCFSPCQHDYNPFEWKRYTLRDFIKILNLPFENDLYYRFVSVVNRVNRLLEKLKCNSCNKLMRDAATSEFAFYRVNTFHCTDSNCNEFHKTVYLTHCLNWRCLNIIDTRVSKACPNGWYICDKCDNCCSQEKIDTRYQNLLTNAAFNPNNSRHQKLKLQVDNKLGHLERNEVYSSETGERK